MTSEPLGAFDPESGRARLTTEIRRLMEYVVSSSADDGVYADAALVARELADQLAGHVRPDDRPRFRLTYDEVEEGRSFTLASVMPFDMIIGACNPMAPPIDISFQPDRAVGEVTFTPTYEGGPGLVHGAALAAAFDIILTAANVMVDGAGPTVRLAIHYVKPTRIGVPCRFEGWVTEKTTRRTHSLGRLVQDGVVTVEAVGEFVNLNRKELARSLERNGSSGSDSDHGRT